ncbi:response regulator [Noviherbaspirillum pedocola]|uniref:Response regulator n=1 Tax=Noviherbaspirillum pedocola TaxID=2801341 RepID=A0A934W7E5_9BURK|nr:response regulator [Noviherbaspirillum pedocola]MBK4737337.1 response regulator [Noviherbaspirillum pedocola]
MHHQTPKALRILLVDDNVDAAEMLKLLLEFSGHDVTVVHDPNVALKHAIVEPPHVAILDIGLPIMDGHELARRLKADTKTAKIHLIAVSGYAQREDLNKSKAAGFDHHFVKPVNIEILTGLLNEIEAGSRIS